MPGCREVLPAANRGHFQPLSCSSIQMASSRSRAKKPGRRGLFLRSVCSGLPPAALCTKGRFLRLCGAFWGGRASAPACPCHTAWGVSAISGVPAAVGVRLEAPGVSAAAGAVAIGTAALSPAAADRLRTMRFCRKRTVIAPFSHGCRAHCPALFFAAGWKNIPPAQWLWRKRARIFTVMIRRRAKEKGYLSQNTVFHVGR